MNQSLPPPRQLPVFSQYSFLEQLRISYGIPPKKEVKLEFREWIRIYQLKPKFYNKLRT